MSRRPAASRSGPTVLALTLTLLASGCSMSQPVPERVRYVLSAERERDAGEASARVLRVGRIRVTPLSERKGFVYRTGERTYQTDFYHEFFAPPSVLLRDQVAAWLESGAVFSAVRTEGGVDADWLLEGRAEQLYADMRQSGTTGCVLEIEFTLLDARSLEEVFRRRYDARVDVVGAEPADFVEAWSEGLAGVLGQLEADLRRAVEAAPALEGS